MIVDSTNLYCGNIVLSGNPADICPYTLFDIWRYEVDAVLGTENDMVVTM